MTLSPSTTGPESIVTSLDWSRKLKEAGWPQYNAMFWWCPYMGESAYSGDAAIRYRLKSENTFGSHDWCKQAGSAAAPTAEEILREAARRRGERVQQLLDNYNLQFFLAQQDDHLANAAAAMWVYLKENNLLHSA